MPEYFKFDEFATHLQLEFFAPQSANAFSLAAARELSSLQARYKKWKRPVIVTSGHPSVFCSGGNLSDYKNLKTKAAGLKVNREIESVLNNFARWPVVKLAVVNGDVLGGGMEWLARFDFRWSTPNVLFCFWQRRIGLSTGWGGGKAWAAQIGEARVRALLLEASILSAGQAMRLGLIDQIVSPWKVGAAAAAWAARVGETKAELLAWRVGGEAKAFTSMWMAEQHKSVLKNWK